MPLLINEMLEKAFLDHVKNIAIRYSRFHTSHLRNSNSPHK